MKGRLALWLKLVFYLTPHDCAKVFSILYGRSGNHHLEMWPPNKSIAVEALNILVYVCRYLLLTKGLLDFNTRNLECTIGWKILWPFLGGILRNLIKIPTFWFWLSPRPKIEKENILGKVVCFKNKLKV